MITAEGWRWPELEIRKDKIVCTSGYSEIPFQQGHSAHSTSSEPLGSQRGSDFPCMCLWYALNLHLLQSCFVMFPCFFLDRCTSLGQTAWLSLGGSPGSQGSLLERLRFSLTSSYHWKTETAMDPETHPNFCKVLIWEPRGWYSVFFVQWVRPIGKSTFFGRLKKNFQPFFDYTNTCYPFFHMWQCWTFHNCPNLSLERLNLYWKGFVSHTYSLAYSLTVNQSPYKLQVVSKRRPLEPSRKKRRSCISWLLDTRSFLS